MAQFSVGPDGRLAIGHVATPAVAIATSDGIQHIPPIFRCLPDLVHGMPVARLILDLAAEIPVNRFHEKPPRFAIMPPDYRVGGLHTLHAP